MSNVKPQNTAKVYKQDIEAAKKRISAEKKNYGKAVDSLIKADKAHTDARRKVEIKSSEKNQLALTVAKKELAMAVYNHKAAADNLDLAIDDLQQKSNRLSRYYHSNGKIRKANIEKVEFEKYYESHADEVKKLSKNAAEIVAAAFQSKTVRKPVRASEMFGANSAYEYARSIPYPQTEEEEKKEPITFSFEESENSSRATLDVTNMVSEAVEATVNRYIAVFEQKLEEYIASIPAPVVNAAPVDTSSVITTAQLAGTESVNAAPQAVATAATVNVGDLSGKSEALDAIAAEETFVVGKLSELVNGMREIMEVVNNLSEQCMAIVEKQKAANEVQQSINEMQRVTMREIQGVQVKQKLVISEQEAVTEEQNITVEHQKLVSENQKALSEEQKISVDEINTLLESQKQVNDTLKDNVASQKNLLALAEKNMDSQKDLTEKQQELIGVQREAMYAFKQVVKGQRAAEAKRRNSQKSQAKKEDSEDKKAEEANVAAEAAVEAAPVEEVAVEAPVEVASEAPAEAAPAEEATVETVSAEEAPAEEAAAEAPVEEAVAEAAPAGEVAVQ